jgi:hypothetical protein
MQARSVLGGDASADRFSAMRSFTDESMTRLLLGPGPSPVDPRVLEALSRPVLGHLDPTFLEIMDDVSQGLREVFRTSNRMTFPVSGTGSAGMEAAVFNILEPGTRSSSASTACSETAWRKRRVGQARW